MYETIINIIVFIFGAIVGSFLNVVALRFRSGKTLAGRSMCFTCGTTLSWFELVPIGSFATQKGKCAHCRTPISWQYPLVEALTGFLFVALYLRFADILVVAPAQFAVIFGYYAILFSILIVLSVYDLKHKILPDSLTFLFAALAFIGMFFISGGTFAFHFPYVWDVLAGILLPAPFTIMWLLSRGKWMGLGDAKLMIGIGFLLGLTGGIAALLLSFWIGAIVSIVILIVAALRGKKGYGLKTAIPFGPFLALGTMIVVIGNVSLSSIASFVSFF